MRILEITLSILAIVLLSPVFLVSALVLKFTGEGEVLYLQERSGKERKPFYVYKFATMLKDSPNLGTGSITENNDPRILPVGKFLRATKLNELPQLLNILKGDMALIGPRPHVARDLQGVDPMVAEIISQVPPGLSGVGSIVFRREESILHSVENPREFYDMVIAPYKADLEVWYVEHKSFWVDMTLVMLTVLVVAGIYSSAIYRIFDDLPEIPDELIGFIQ